MRLVSSRLRYVSVMALFGYLTGCDLLEQEPPPPELPPLQRSEPAADPPPSPVARDFWEEQLLTPPTAALPPPRSEFLWHETLDSATEEAEREQRPIFILLRCPIGERSGSFDDELLSGVGPASEMLSRFVTVVIGDASQIDLGRMNFPALQDPDQTWWCWVLSPRGELISGFGPGLPEEIETATSVKFEGWLQRVLEHWYDPRRTDWRRDASAPVGVRIVGETIATSPFYSQWRDKAAPLEHLRTQANCACCHQVRDALWMAQTRFDRLLEWWIWPAESVLGITFSESDPLTIAAVAAKSPAESAGLRPGDRIGGVRHSLAFSNWPLFSRTDFRAVIHNLPWEDGQLTLVVLRDGALVDARISIVNNPQWRRYDLTWRKSLSESIFASHPGFLPTQTDAAIRKRLGLSETEGMAIVPVIGPGSPNFRRGLTPETVLVKLAYVDDNLSNDKFLAMFNILVPPGSQSPVEVINTRTGERKRFLIQGLSIFDIPKERP